MSIKEHTSYLDEFNNLDVAGYAALHPALFSYVKDAMAQPSKQFLLIGDFDHDSKPLQNFLCGAPLAALFRNAAIPHVAVETTRETLDQRYLDAFHLRCRQYQRGRIDKEEIDKHRDWLFDRGPKNIPNTKKTLLGFMQAGLRMTPADSDQWQGGAPGNAERLFLGDREVAHYIRSRANGEKTGVVYGAGHFSYDDAMASRLGHGKCVRIDVYPDRAAYEKLGAKHRLHVDMVPDKVYILDERSLENPDMTLYRSADRGKDPLQQARLKAARLYGSNAQMTADNGGLVPRRGFDRQWFTYVPEVA